MASRGLGYGREPTLPLRLELQAPRPERDDDDVFTPMPPLQRQCQLCGRRGVETYRPNRALRSRFVREVPIILARRRSRMALQKPLQTSWLWP